MRQKFLLAPLLFNTDLEFLARTIRQKQKIKWIQIGKFEFTLSISLKNLKILLKTVRNPKLF
jgi:hypothetical protein